MSATSVSRKLYSVPGAHKDSSVATAQEKVAWVIRRVREAVHCTSSYTAASQTCSFSKITDQNFPWGPCTVLFLSFPQSRILSSSALFLTSFCIPESVSLFLNLTQYNVLQQKAACGCLWASFCGAGRWRRKVTPEKVAHCTNLLLTKAQSLDHIAGPLITITASKKISSLV